MGPGGISNRELASMIWVGVAIVFCGASPTIRPTLLATVRAALRPKIVLPVLLMAGYTTGAVLIGSWLGLWEQDLAGETIFWFLVSAPALFISLTTVGDDRRFFASLYVKALSVSALLSGLVNLFVFPLYFELVLVPVLTLAVALAAVASHKPEYRSVDILLRTCLAIAAVAFLVDAAVRLADTWSHSTVLYVVRDLLLPVWLVIALVPYLFALSVAIALELAFLRVDFAEPADVTSRRQARLALLLTAGLDPYALNRFGVPWSGRLVRARSLQSARRVVRHYRAELRSERASP